MQTTIDLKSTSTVELESYAYKQICQINSLQKALNEIEKEIISRIPQTTSPVTSTEPIEAVTAEIIPPTEDATA